MIEESKQQILYESSESESSQNESGDSSKPCNEEHEVEQDDK